MYTKCAERGGILSVRREGVLLNVRREGYTKCAERGGILSVQREVVY